MAEIIKLHSHIRVRFAKQDIEALYNLCKNEIGLQENESLQSGDFSRWYRNRVKTQILKNGKEQRGNRRGQKYDKVAH